MAKCKFSETQFSFCFTFEFIEKNCPWSSVPIFPSTYLEGQTDYGYDVNIAGHLYFQFKIPDYIKRRKKGNSNQWDNFNKPYYRSKINTDSEQHNLLHQLKLKDANNEVLYIMPKFNDNTSISIHYNKKQIVDHSAAFPIETFPSHKSGYHFLCYDAGGRSGKLFSEPQNIDIYNVVDLVNKMRNNKSKTNNQIDEAKRIKQILLNIDKSPYRNYKLEEANDNKQLVNTIRNILISYYDVIWAPILPIK